MWKCLKGLHLQMILISDYFKMGLPGHLSECGNFRDCKDEWFDSKLMHDEELLQLFVLLCKAFREMSTLLQNYKMLQKVFELKEIKIFKGAINIPLLTAVEFCRAFRLTSCIH